MDKKKRQQFSLKEKREILLEVEKGGKKGGIAKKYGISPSTLSTFLKQKSKIEQNIDADALGPQRKKMRTADYEEVDKAVYTWFVEMRAKNIPINGPLLCERARSFARSLGFPEFMGSTGWLHRFRERYGISHKIINGEANDAPKEVASSWRLETLRAALKEYSPADIYNADETALFYKLMPNKTLEFKGNKCFGGKSSKERITALLCTNSTGTDKLKPLIIGKFGKPRCFKGVQHLPCEYRHNTKAWMTSVVFEEWLLCLERRMKAEKRRILLIIDNCSSHNCVPRHLEHVKVLFLPPSTTSILQPLDQGIIHAVKRHYRARVVRRMLCNIASERDINVNILEAMQMFSAAWRALKEEIIANCFRKAGVVYAEDDITESEVLDDAETEENWKRLCEKLDVPTSVNLTDYVNVDCDVIVQKEITDDEIVADIMSDGNPCDDEVEEEDMPQSDRQSLTLVQATNMARSLQDFLLSRSDVPESVLNSCAVVGDYLERSFVSGSVQRKITDFFKK